MITTGRPSEIIKEVSFSVKANVGTKSQSWSGGVNLIPDGGPKSQGRLNASRFFPAWLPEQNKNNDYYP